MSDRVMKKNGYIPFFRREGEVNSFGRNINGTRKLFRRWGRSQTENCTKKKKTVGREKDASSFVARLTEKRGGKMGGQSCGHSEEASSHQGGKI